MKSDVEPILLVEDDPNDQLLIRRAFAKAKLMNPLLVVEDGDAAVAYLAGEGAYADRSENPLPAVMLLDLKLPRRSGLEVLEWLRSQPGSLGRTPVVVLTSSRENSDLDRAYDLGANSYLVKPVDFDGLLDLVRTAGLYWTVLNERPRNQ
ncbi:response regulator [Arenibaculum pallidiluteum]|uniref:response regulator n=1 Tax=Arenibaculum pallidiluteum TaxID=2812559 RepID=UPI001A96E6E3|nr:response regulator [Arenibaculum pallidiluteum]